MCNQPPVLMAPSKFFKVFVLEDSMDNRAIIAKELSEKNYLLHFFCKNNSVLELLNFTPDILIHDYFQNKVTNCYEWNRAY